MIRLSRPSLGQDFWSVIPALVNAGTSVYTQEEQQKMAKDAANAQLQAAANAAKTQAIIDANAQQQYIAGINPVYFYIGAGTLGVVGLLVGVYFLTK